jgi:hypothetical protein
MLTNIVACDADEVRIGQPVTLVFQDTDGGPPVPIGLEHEGGALSLLFGFQSGAAKSASSCIRCGRALMYAVTTCIAWL